MSTALDRYLARLPEGLDSYPELQCKGSLIRGIVDKQRIRPAERTHLPAAIRQHLEDPPLVSGWYPETHLVAIMLAHLDLAYDGREAAFAAWFYDLAAELYAKPLYRFLMVVASPERLIRGFARRWGAMHRNSQLQLLDEGPGRVELALDIPEPLYPRPIPATTMHAIRAALDAAGARNATGSVERGPGPPRLILTWDR